MPGALHFIQGLRQGPNTTYISIRTNWGTLKKQAGNPVRRIPGAKERQLQKNNLIAGVGDGQDDLGGIISAGLS